MSEEMKSIEGLRSSDVFDLTAVGFPSFWSDEQVRVCGRAIRNYDEMKDKADRLIKENRKLREALSDCAHRLIESSGELSCYIDMKNSELKQAIRCDDLDPPDYHDAQTAFDGAIQANKAKQLLEELK